MDNYAKDARDSTPHSDDAYDTSKTLPKRRALLDQCAPSAIGHSQASTPPMSARKQRRVGDADELNTNPEVVVKSADGNGSDSESSGGTGRGESAVTPPPLIPIANSSISVLSQA